MIKLLSSAKNQIIEILYFICRAFVEWYFRYYDLPYCHDIECYLDYPKK